MRRSRSVLVTAGIALTLATPGWAGGEKGSVEVEWGALFELEGAAGLSTSAPGKVEWSLKPTLEVELSRRLALTLVARLRGDPVDRITPGTPAQTSRADGSERLLLGDGAEAELRELYAEVSAGDAFLILGKQQIVWGQADGLKVLDVVNPQDFREFILDDFEDSRIPLWAVNAELPLGSTLLQLVWIPDTTYHDLPAPGAAFAVTAPSLRPAVGAGVPVTVREAQRPGRIFGDSDLGVRLSTFWKGWDLTANYLYHYQDTPVPLLELSGEGAGRRGVVTPSYERTHLLGGTFSTAVGNLTVRGEVGYSTDRFVAVEAPPDAYRMVETGELAYVVGLDWFGLSDSLISLQLFQSYLTEDLDRPLGPEVDTNATLLVERRFRHETVEAEAILIHNLAAGDGLIRPELRYAPRDDLWLWVGMDLFYGDPQGIFGEFDDRDRIVAGLEIGL